jgi:dethiobiotin synthetase/malonyl-CoA O-methyltransferase
LTLEKGLFITGTGTDVGKTWVSSWLVLSLQADYWKPFQTGTKQGYDRDIVAQCAPNATLHQSLYEFQAPLSPEAAARLENQRIDFDRIKLPPSSKPIIIEGAGGVLVPLTPEKLMIDLIETINLPVIIVASSALGTINHTLLTIEALRQRLIEPLGFIFSGHENRDNQEAISHYSSVPCLGQLPYLQKLSDIKTLPFLSFETLKTAYIHTQRQRLT